MPVARWKEALEFASDAGMQVVFNLNVLAGRWDDFAHVYTHKSRRNPTDPFPSWDSSNVRIGLHVNVSLKSLQRIFCFMFSSSFFPMIFLKTFP